MKQPSESTGRTHPYLKTEYISCPGCGRTLYNLESTIARIKAATSHLKGLKIGIMGCIVNGPGEMADADYGYVGAGRGKISLYKKKECIEKNIPEEHAVVESIELIKANGDYHSADRSVEQEIRSRYKKRLRPLKENVETFHFKGRSLF